MSGLPLTTDDMSAIIQARDLSKRAPHSPRKRVGGYAIAVRAVDKCRAAAAGTPGEYHYNCPMDNMLFSFKGVTGAQFQTAVAAAKSYEDVAVWLQANGDNKTPDEVKAWSDGVEAGSPMKDPERRASFVADCQRLGINPEECTTFDWVEATDRATFHPVPRHVG